MQNKKIQLEENAIDIADINYKPIESSDYLVNN